jgi:phenylpyruvate tautomerase PptA (4-oxalocrotonate tautomerase family)
MSKMISVETGWRNMMPLWTVYHPVGAYSAQDKKEFAEKVTAMYSRVPIPKFYVVMIFEEVAQSRSMSAAHRTANSFVSSSITWPGPCPALS